MGTPVEVTDLGVVADMPLYAGLSPELVFRHAPDAHWAWRGRSGGVTARCSLWWTATPGLPGERLGIIGHYAATEAAAGRALLAHVCEVLTANACTMAVGPMDGNTWRSYRLVTERGDRPPFFLEPENPPDWPRHFTGAGFSVMARYLSSLGGALAQRDPRARRAWSRLNEQGVRLRPLDVSRMREELDRIFDVSLAAFGRNFLYTPLAREEFHDQYTPVLEYVRPELCLLAEEEGEAVGFVFALPDLLQARVGGKVDTVVLKTVAVRPGRRRAGLGAVLVDRVHAAAHDLGYRFVIHALMHEANVSRNLSARSTRVMRRYALYARRLPGPRGEARR